MQTQLVKVASPHFAALLESICVIAKRRKSAGARAKLYIHIVPFAIKIARASHPITDNASNPNN